jgi:hypothetical protein
VSGECDLTESVDYRNAKNRLIGREIRTHLRGESNPTWIKYLDRNVLGDFRKSAGRDVQKLIKICNLDSM